MAYKQSPGRSPFLKTGRGIPLNMISPLHDGTTPHPHEGHKEEVDRNTQIPAYKTEKLNVSSKVSGSGKESTETRKTTNLQELESKKIDLGKDFVPTQKQTNQANLKIKEATDLDARNTAINTASSGSGVESLEEQRNKSFNVTQLGNQSLANVSEIGNTQNQNFMSQRDAELLQSDIDQKSDSTNYMGGVLKDASTLNLDPESTWYKQQVAKAGAVSYETGVANEARPVDELLNRYLTGQTGKDIKNLTGKQIKEGTKQLNMNILNTNEMNDPNLSGESGTGAETAPSLGIIQNLRNKISTAGNTVRSKILNIGKSLQQ